VTGQFVQLLHLLFVAEKSSALRAKVDATSY